MRLTLRTLLAYLDDTLEPAQAKVIGQKVAESKVAQELIEKIKQVTRRRRLTAPPATGEGAVDGNVVAEYLDNVLPTDELAEVEETFLHSDVHLAEVAACHQILTLFLGQPATVPPTAKKRMYALAKEDDKKHPFRLKARKAALAALDEEEEGDELVPTEGPPGLPHLFRKGGPVRRYAPFAGIVALVAVLAFAVGQLLNRNSGKPGDTAQVAVSDTSKDKATPDSQPKKEDPDKKDPDKKDPDKKDPDKKDPDKVPLDTVPVDKPSMERRVLGKYVAGPMAGPSVLLQWVNDKNAWQRVKPAAPASSADALVSLPGYRSELQLDNGVRCVLWGNVPEYSTIQVFESSATFHAPEAPYDVDCTLERGRLVLANTKPEGTARVKVRLKDEIWDLTLKESDSVVALEVTGFYQPGTPFSRKAGGEGPMAVVDLLGFSGTTEVKIRYGRFELSSPAHYRWTSTGSTARGATQLPNLPKWYTEPVPNTPQAKEMTVALEELSKRIGVGKPIDVVLTEARKENKGAGLILCILCMGAVDDLGDLVATLVDDRPDARWAAIYTLSQWIARKNDNDLKMFDALKKNGYSEVQAQTVMDLLHGFSEDDGSKPETYETLIDYLRHEKLVIREMAWRHLVQLWPDGRKIPYNPAGSPEMREGAFKEWKIKIPSGKLPPKAAPKQ